MRYKDFLPDLVKIYKPKSSYQKKVVLESFKCYYRDKLGSKTAKIKHLFEQIQLSPRSFRRTWGTLRIKSCLPLRQYKSESVQFYEKHKKVMHNLISNVVYESQK